MGRRPCCEKVGLKRGSWSAEEDKKLINFILTNGQCCWRTLPKLAGLLRCGKSCRLRWTNYLRPDLKRGILSEYEEKMVIDLHAQLGNRWSKIASHLPGRTDNEIKNYWNTSIKKKLTKMGIDPLTHKPLPPPPEEEEVVLQSTSLQQSTVTEANNNSKDEDIKSTFESTTDLLLLVNNADFCTDEIPVIAPHEILLSNSPALSSSSSSSSNSVVGGAWHSDVLEDIVFSPGFEDYCSEIMNSNIWNDEFVFLPDYDEVSGKLNLL